MAEAELNVQQKQTDLAIAQSNEKQAAFDIESAQLEVQQASTEQLSLGQKILNSLLGPLSLLISLYTAISAIITVINMKKAQSIALSEAETVKEKKKFAVMLKNAGAAMAESAAKIPVAGWVIAAAILAAVGAAIAVTAINQNQDDKIDDTADSLNKVQAELYNLNHGIETVKKLGDEFDTLSNKIIKSSDDLKRLAEIAKQINDEAGDTVVDTNADLTIQSAQIAGYQRRQEAKYQTKVSEANTTLGTGFKDAMSAQASNDA